MGLDTEEAQFHVLAVDDSVIDRKLIERLLKTSSYQVTTVDSGSKALEFLGLQEETDQRNSKQTSDSSDHHQEIQVNLIITDYCMPGMTGYDLLKKIKESSCLKDIPVVIMSSENVPARINRCLEEGAEEFFLKPVKLSDVKKLQPHLLKGKSKENTKWKLHQHQQEQQHDDVHCKDHQQNVQQIEHQQQHQQHHQHSKKRKSMEEAMTPERTRPRLSGLTVV